MITIIIVLIIFAWCIYTFNPEFDSLENENEILEIIWYNTLEGKRNYIIMFRHG